LANLKQKSKYFLAFISILLLLTFGFIYWQIEQTLQQNLQIDKPTQIIIPSGASLFSLSKSLEQQGLVRNTKWLRFYWRLQTKIMRKPPLLLKSGKYQIAPNITLANALQLWSVGQVTQHKITIIEGWNMQQIRRALAADANLVQHLPNIKNEDLMAKLGRTGHPEGRFFPATYNFVYPMSDLDILRQAADKLDKVLAQEWQNRAQGLPYKDSYQALIMASIVEKETAKVSEYEQIAGVFVRRLQKKMRLQTDPTVIYGMGDKYKGKIGRKDLRTATPYNTYVIYGLPPTPIASAGLGAIAAAMHPDASDALYFVAKGDGSHYFSKDLAEHNKAVREYQLKRRSDYRSTPNP